MVLVLAGGGGGVDGGFCVIYVFGGGLGVRDIMRRRFELRGGGETVSGDACGGGGGCSYFCLGRPGLT